MIFINLLLLATYILRASMAEDTSYTPSTTDFKWSTQFVQSRPPHLRVIVQGYGPTVVIIPSYGQDGGDDFNYFPSSLA
jgi:hypothetical protein